jgi:hypothetical protein
VFEVVSRFDHFQHRVTEQWKESTGWLLLPYSSLSAQAGGLQRLAPDVNLGTDYAATPVLELHPSIATELLSWPGTTLLLSGRIRNWKQAVFPKACTAP